MKDLKTFVSGGKFDKFRLGQVMSGVKVTKFDTLFKLLRAFAHGAMGRRIDPSV